MSPCRTVWYLFFVQKNVCRFQCLPLRCDRHEARINGVANKKPLFNCVYILPIFPLKFNGSYWEKFTQELHCHLDSKYNKFWVKGFETPQNINDRLTLEKEIKRAKDPIFVTTMNEKPMKTDCEEIDF